MLCFSFIYHCVKMIKTAFVWICGFYAMCFWPIEVVTLSLYLARYMVTELSLVCYWTYKAVFVICCIKLEYLSTSMVVMWTNNLILNPIRWLGSQKRSVNNMKHFTSTQLKVRLKLNKKLKLKNFDVFF